MGSAVAGTLLAAGHQVIVWNRTPARYAPLVAAGAHPAGSPAEAIADADLVILTLLDYAAATAVLSDCAAQLTGRTVVNLITGTPAEAEMQNSRVTGNGGRYLEGVIAAYPGDIGHPDTLFYLAGDRQVWAEQEPVLRQLAGAAAYVGTEPGAANVMDAAMTAAFYDVSIGAFIEGVSFARSAGVDLREIRSTLGYWLNLLHQELTVALDDIENDSHTTDQATLETYLIGMRTCRQAMVDAGERAPLLGAAVATLQRAHDAGHGAAALSAQIKTARTGTSR